VESDRVKRELTDAALNLAAWVLKQLRKK
jgi:hypothetical protein